MLIVAIIGFSSCGVRHVSTVQYEEVQMNGEAYSINNFNYVHIYSKGDSHTIYLYTGDSKRQKISTEFMGDVEMEGDIHYLFLGFDKEKEILIDVSRHEVSIYQQDTPVITYVRPYKTFRAIER